MSDARDIFLKADCTHCRNGIEYPLELRGETIKCPHCGEFTKLGNATAPIIIQQSAPPVMPLPPPQQPQTIYVREEKKTGCLTQIIALFLIGGLVLFIVSLFNESPSSIPDFSNTSSIQKPKPKADVSISDYQVTIKNSDTNDWPEMNVYLNERPPDSFGIRIQPLAQGESATYSLNKFTKSNGERFNPNAYKVITVWIGGDSYDYEGYTSF